MRATQEVLITSHTVCFKASLINLSPNEFEILLTENKNRFQQFIFNCRSWVVATLQKYIRGEKEQGLAEALLIGYKDDLDKNLVQSYTNTGVVHIIAIQGYTSL